MYCPVCSAEYRPGFTVCSDCQIALVSERPRAASADASPAGDSGNASFSLLWSGSDARVHAEICEALAGRGIPVRSLDSDDYLFNLAMRPAHQVYVPAGLVSAARETIQQVNAVEESVDAAESGALELPAEEDLPEENYYEDERDHRGSGSRRPRDQSLDPYGQRSSSALAASTEIWSGQNADLAAMIASSLRENGIPSRCDPDRSDPAQSDRGGEDANKVLSQNPTIAIFVHSEDESRAREIIREILNAAPPE